MAKRGSGPWSGWSTVLVIVAIVTFVWGLERWRNDAARRASGSEQSRVTALARCLLGPDGVVLLRTPDEARRRLRLLAMDTPAEASMTWFDRCVPIARALAAHASEVDDTRAITAARSRVAENARSLLEAVERVGLVWRIRSGDPETDMDLVADRLARLADEISLTSVVDARAIDLATPIAPAPHMRPEGALIATPGLEPAPIGRPTRFLVGAPLPSVSAIERHDAGRYTRETAANAPSFAWRAGPNYVARIDAEARSYDHLAYLEYIAGNEVRGQIVTARITPVSDPAEGAHTAIDAVVSGDALWLARWTPWDGAAVAPFFAWREITPIQLSMPEPDRRVRSHDALLARSTALDEHVAIASDEGRGVLVAFTERAPNGGTTVSVQRLRANAASASDLERVMTRTTTGGVPSVEFCARDRRPPVLLVAAGNDWWLARIDATEVAPIAHVEATDGTAFGTRVVLRCDDESIVAYGREQPRTSPVIACTGDDDRCETLSAPRTPVLTTLPAFTTRSIAGRPIAHPDWPVAIVRAGTSLVAAMALGSIVSVSRREMGASNWEPDRVVFDAAARTHGAMVQGVGVYAERGLAALAIATPEGLRIFESDDAGRSWH